MYGAFSIQLAGGISSEIPWSYISPISWWDHNDNSFGVQQLTASSSSYEAGGGAGSSSFGNNWWNEQSSSTSASVGVSFGFAGGSADYSHSDASNAFADNSGRSSWSNFADKSSDATVTCEFFLATIERPWLLGDLLNMDGWYLVTQKKNGVSDVHIVTQVGDQSKILPMIPKAFLVMRNVSITADDWGEAGNAFDTAQQNASGSGESSSNSYGASVSYFCAIASFQQSDQQASGAFDSNASSNSGWQFSRNGNGGTLKLMGSQIIGWVGEIQPASPKIDDPGLAKSANTSSTTTSATTSATNVAASGTAG